MTIPNFVNAFKHEGVVRSHCAIFDGEVLLYVGPIHTAPIVRDGQSVYLHPSDFEYLNNRLDFFRH